MYQTGTLEKALGVLLLCVLEERGGSASLAKLNQVGMNAGFTQEQVYTAINSLANVAFVRLEVAADAVTVQRNPEKELETYAGKKLMEF